MSILCSWMRCFSYLQQMVLFVHNYHLNGITLIPVLITARTFPRCVIPWKYKVQNVTNTDK